MNALTPVASWLATTRGPSDTTTNSRPVNVRPAVPISRSLQSNHPWSVRGRPRATPARPIHRHRAHLPPSFPTQLFWELDCGLLDRVFNLRQLLSRQFNFKGSPGGNSYACLCVGRKPWRRHPRGNGVCADTSGLLRDPPWLVPR